MSYSFDQIFAADPSNPERVASNGVVTIFAPGDESRTPLLITTVEGMAIQNPVQVNDSGHGPAFMHETLDRVAWEGGGFSGFFTSYEGMKQEAVAARVSAGEAAVAAVEAAANSVAPTAQAVEREIVTEGTPARTAVELVAGQAASTAAAPKLDKTAAANMYAVKPDNGGKPVGKGELMANVRDFGAKGDGLASDSAGIQAAIDWLDANGGGDLLIPRGANYGDYWIRDAVKLRSNIRIIGSGMPILRKKVGDPAYAIFAGLSSGKRGYGSGASNIEAFGIEFRGTFGTATTPERSACAFALHHAENVLVRNCNFIEMQITGHVFDLSGCRNITIRDNVFRGMKKSTGPGNAECIQIDQSKSGSLSFADSPGSYDGLMTCDVTIQNNQFLPYTAPDGTWYPAGNIGGNHTTRQGVYYENIKIIDNYVEDPIVATSNYARGNIHLQGTKNAEILRNKWVSTRGGVTKLIAILTVEIGNALDNDPEVATPVSAIPAQGCLGVRIEGNTFEGFQAPASTEHLIHVFGVTGKAHVLSGIRISGNTFRSNASLENTGSEPVNVQFAKMITISDNAYIGFNNRACGLLGVMGLKVDGNMLDSTLTQPFWIDGCTDVSLTRNSWRDARNAPRIRNSTNVLVAENMATEPVGGKIGFVLEAVARFNVTGNNFSTDTPLAGGVTLSGSANAQGRIAGNACYGYTSAVSGTGAGVTIAENSI